MDINKESDKNVVNEKVPNNKNKYIYIKEVAKKIRNEYREKYKDEKFPPEPSERTCMAYEILNLLAEREEDKKKINKLEYCVEELKKYNKTISDRVVEYKKNRIPKRKIKDKIKEYKENLIQEISNTKGTISKSKLFDIINSIK